jgi:hypothetical protein
MNMKQNAQRLSRQEMKAINGGYKYFPQGNTCADVTIPCPGRITPNGVACCSGLADCLAAYNFCAAII